MNVKLLNENPRTYVLVFETGDEAVSGIERWAGQEKIGAASVSAIGAFRRAVLGFFSWEQKEYERIPVDHQAEVVSLLGDIALKDAQPMLHAHAVLGGRDGSALAGHLMEGEVRPTLEVVVVEAPVHLRRRTDAATGLALISPSL